MDFGQKLQAAVGRNIDQICANRFVHPGDNHCAHFVSHMCGLGFSMHCGQLTGGRRERANVRVQEIFAQSPKVGRWQDADPQRTQLIFVTRAENVDLRHKRMENIPRKHVGIYHQGLIYHYRNSSGQVDTDTPDSFFQYFTQAYGTGQGLFYGWIPGEDLLLNVRESGVGASAARKFELRQTAPGVWGAREINDAAGFFVGREVNQPRRGYLGIGTGPHDFAGPRFDPTEYESRLDLWAYLLWITGFGESNNYLNVINTYDRAKFTFGFYQLAAHTPGDNLILLFRRLAELPNFAAYFPELRIVEGRLARVDDDGSLTNLETPFRSGPSGEPQLQFFMNYLNPTRTAIEPQEILHSARLIHWTMTDPLAQLAQVQVAAYILQNKMMRVYAPKLGLNGRSAIECAIVADILHQGRGKFSLIAAALNSAQPVRALLQIGVADYPGRIQALKTALTTAEDKLANRFYVAATNEFRTA